MASSEPQDMIVIEGGQQHSALATLLEGYLYGLGEVCHRLFGAKGEAAMYQAIGSLFLAYLESKGELKLSASDPWLRYCEIIRFFTENGFYRYVELKSLGDGRYWMLETGQYAGAVWEEQGAWQRGTPPCPLWSVVVYALSQINYAVVLDEVSFKPENQGYVSTFHFEHVERPLSDPLSTARKELRLALVPICASCKRIRIDETNWVEPEVFFAEHYDTLFSHGLCPACVQRLYPEYQDSTPA